MKKSSNQNLNILPEWYWERGLHDACIVGVETFEFPYDYNKYDGKKVLDKNLFLLHISAKGAMFDSDVKQIRLFNYKIISENNLTIKERAWWLSDRLIQENGFYFLEIDIEDFDSIPQNYTFKIKFERAEVDR